MKIIVKEKNDSLIEFNVSMLWKDIEEDYDNELNKVLLNVKEKGARKGKLKGIQRELFIKNNKSYIDSQFVDYAMNTYYREALKEKQLNPLNQGKVTTLDFDGKKTDFNFIIEFEIKPKLDKKIPNYKKKVTIKSNHYIATKKDVERSMNDFRTQHSKMKTLEDNEKLKSGHFIHADFTKLDDDNKPIDGSTLPNHHIKIGEGLFAGDLEKPFLNKKVGDIINIVVNQENSDVKYSVKINKIEEQTLPKVDNEFVKQIDKELKTVTQLEEKLQKNIQLNLDNENKKEFQNKIVEYFLEKTQCVLPQSMIDNYRSYLVEDHKSKNPDSFDEGKMSKELDDMSNKNIKWLLIREHLFESEQISMKPDEVAKKIEDMIKESPTYKKDIKKFYGDDKNRNKLREDLLNSKLFNNLEKYFVNKAKEVPTDKIKNIKR